MRISRAQIGQIVKVYKAQNAIQAAPKGLAPDSGISSDRIKLSFSQADLDKVKEQIKKLPDLRPDRVQELSQSVRDGTYKVDPTEVADRMLGRMIADKIK